MIRYTVLAVVVAWLVVWVFLVDWQRVRRAWREGGWLSLLLLTFLGLMIAQVFVPHRLEPAASSSSAYALSPPEPDTVPLVVETASHHDWEASADDAPPMSEPDDDDESAVGLVPLAVFEPPVPQESAVGADTPELPELPSMQAREPVSWDSVIEQSPEHAEEVGHTPPPLPDLMPEAPLFVETDEGVPSPPPRVSLEVQAPQRAYVHVPANYVVRLTNMGDHDADNLSLVHYLPRGAKVLQASGEATQDTAAQQVRWELPALRSGEAASVEVVLVYPEVGEYRPTFEADVQGRRTDAENLTFVESIPALTVELVDESDPVAVDGDASYRIEVANQGRSTATRVALVAELPSDFSDVAVEGPGNHEVKAGRWHFQPVSHFAPGQQVTYVIRARPQKAGHQRVRVTLSADHLRKPVREEEDTCVYDPTGDAAGDE